MSTDYSTYVGPYVRCAVAQVATERTRRACTNPTCPQHKTTSLFSQGFCNRCGSPIGDVAYTDMADRIDAWDMSERIDGVLTTAHGDAYSDWVAEHGAHLWKPNQHIDLAAGYLERREDFALFTITPELINAEILHFQVRFESEIDALRERYGRDAVSIHWGVIQDYL